MNQRPIPNNSNEIKRDNLNAVVYSYINMHGKLAAVAYQGKSNKATWCYWFGCEADRQKRIDQFFESVRQQQEFIENRKAEKKAFHHGYKPGDILSGSWGYDQTNREFYQVTGVNPASNSILIRKIGGHAVGGSGGFMCQDVVVDKNKFCGPERRAMVNPSYRAGEKGSLYITVEINGQWDKNGTRVSLSEWDGKPEYESWYA
jgi:hypothetical protein